MPLPSKLPPPAPPARVVTTADEVSIRITYPLRSATYIVPVLSVAILYGFTNEAAVPVPSMVLDPPDPANVVTPPSGVILRIT